MTTPSGSRRTANGTPIVWCDRCGREHPDLPYRCVSMCDLCGFIHPARGVRGLLPDDSDDYLAGPDLRPAPVTPGQFTFTFRFQETA